VAQIVTGPPFGLVEALAEAIAAAVGERYNAVESVLVRVRKPNPPVEGQFDGLEIQIERRIGR
jgi:dihydroneopterin aldolase